LTAAQKDCGAFRPKAVYVAAIKHFETAIYVNESVLIVGDTHGLVSSNGQQDGLINRLGVARESS
jgi:uncharacterized ion transporter superfamily protein YfcC